MPNSIEDNILLYDVVAHPVGPDLKPPLTNAFALELLDLGWWAEGIRRQALGRFKHLLLD